MSFDWGGFTGSIVGVIGVYGVFILQRNEDRRKSSPIKRQKHFILKDTVENAIIGLASAAVLDTQNELKVFTDEIGKVIGYIQQARIQNAELNDERISSFLDDLSKDIGSMSVEVYKTKERQLVAKTLIKTRCTEYHLKYTDRFEELKN